MTGTTLPHGLLGSLRPDALDQAVAALRPRGGNLVIVGEPGTGKLSLAQLAIEALTVELGTRPHPELVVLNASDTLSDIPFALIDAVLPRASCPTLRSPEAAYAEVTERLGTRPGGALILLDDADSSDEASLLLAVALAEHPDFRVVITARDLRTLPPAIDRLLRFGSCPRIELGPLSFAQHTRLAAAVLGSVTIEAESAARLFHTSGGNPLFLIELLARLQRTAQLSRHGDLVSWSGDERDTPPSLTGFLERELAQARPETRSAIITIALAEPVLLATLMHVSDVADPDAIDRLLTHRIIRQDRSADGTVLVRTANQVIGDTVRAAAPLGQRLTILARLAETLPTDLALAPSETLLRGVGVLLDAGAHPEPASLRRALAHAQSAGDHRVTIRFAEALAAHPDLSETEQLSTHAARLIAIRLDGDPRFLDDPDLLRLPETALLPHPADTAEVARARVGLLLAWADILLYRDDRVNDALALLEHARSTLHEAHIGAAQDLRTGTIIRLGYAGRFAEATVLAVATGASEDPAANIAVAAVLSLSDAQRGHAAPARERSWGALPLALAQHATSPTIGGELIAAMFAGEILSGHPATARNLLQRITRELEHPIRTARPSHGLVGIASGTLALAEGRWSDASGEFAAALRSLRQRDGSGFATVALAGSALALAASGRHAEAWDALTACATTPPRASRVVEGLTRLNTVTAAFWLSDGSAPAQARDLAVWARARGLLLVELRALHLASLADLPGPKTDLDRAEEIADELTGPLARDLIEAIRQRRDGGPLRDCPAVRRLARRGVWLPLRWRAPLTPREREVAGFAVLGYSAKQTAATLGITARTVESHLARAFAKLRVNDREGLALHLGHREQLSEASP